MPHFAATPMLIVTAVTALSTSAARAQAWPVHSMDRPRPPIVHPGPERAPVPAPADAIVLFNGDGLDAWEADDSIPRPAGWKVAGGYMEVVAGSGSIRTPGQWQTYDIIFRRPRFGADGGLLRAALATVIHNGIVVQDAVAFKGATTHAREAVYQSHPNRLPLGLQDHDHPVRFRNIWVRELPEE